LKCFYKAIADSQASDPTKIKAKDNLRRSEEYASDALIYLRKREELIHFPNNFLQAQPDILIKREHTIEWLIRIQTQYKLSEDTLFMSVNILDRYLSKKPTNNISLLAITALNIAAKYEEIYPPHLKELANGKHSIKEILAMEVDVLCVLDYELSFPNVSVFIERFREIMGLNVSNVALYICEAQLLTPGMCNYLPSLQALSAIYLSQKLTNKAFPINSLPLKEANHSEGEVIQCSRDMLSNMLAKEKILLSNVRRKYKDVAKIVFKKDLLS